MLGTSPDSSLSTYVTTYLLVYNPSNAISYIDEKYCTAVYTIAVQLRIFEYSNVSGTTPTAVSTELCFLLQLHDIEKNVEGDESMMNECPLCIARKRVHPARRFTLHLYRAREGWVFWWMNGSRGKPYCCKVYITVSSNVLSGATQCKYSEIIFPEKGLSPVTGTTNMLRGSRQTASHEGDSSSSSLQLNHPLSVHQQCMYCPSATDGWLVLLLYTTYLVFLISCNQCTGYALRKLYGI